ncbi:MAG: AAA family ATPase [Myxococcales bacterium]|nr:AAA family ATPase [Myxococcales bacterium]
MTTAEAFYADAVATDPDPWEQHVTIVPTEWYTAPAPPRRWLLRDGRAGDEGVLPLGKVGLLVAEGGAGKTMAVVQLALAVACGGSWLDTFEVPERGKVLLILGEEDAEEVHRRIHRAARGRGSTPPERSIVALPLAGVTCSMIEEGGDSGFLVWLKEFIQKTGPYALIVVDPVSRFCGADAERDNAAGTRFCQALESLVVPAGGATVLGSHHTNKQSRGSGAVVGAASARGSSALVDGVRWVAAIGVEFVEGGPVDTVLTLSVVKTNYARKPKALELRYGDDGELVPLLDDDKQAATKARDEAAPQARRQRKRDEAKTKREAEIDAAVLDCVRATPGIGASELRLHIKAKAGCGADAADTAVARMIQAGRVQRSEGKTRQHFLVANASSEATDSSDMNGTSAFHLDLDAVLETLA